MAEEDGRGFDADEPRRASVESPTVPEDLVSMLDLLAQTIVDALGFGVAVINIAHADGSLEVISVAGDDAARDVLLGSSDSAEVWDRMLAASEQWGRLRFLRHDAEEAALDHLLSWIPDVQVSDAENAWHPEDALFAPLTAEDGRRLGVLSVDLPHDGLLPGPVTVRAVEAFAVSTALAIEHATLRARAEASEQRFRELATLDPLTGLGNRSVLADRVGHALTVRGESASMLALVFIDLDGFKAVNDRLSHAAGDSLLRTVAHRIRDVVRPHDTVVRWGGDEFLIFLEDIDEEATLDVVRRVSSAAGEPITELGEDVRVTASVGVTFWRAADGPVAVDDLVKQADAAMYQVKHQGRNDYAVFKAPTDSESASRSRAGPEA